MRLHLEYPFSGRWLSYAGEIISAVLILVFLYTALSKLADVEKFVSSLRRFPHLNAYAMALAWSIPIAEILTACLLFFPQTRRYGLWASLALLSGFTLFLTYMVLLVPNLPCSCGGIISRLSWKEHIVFNLVLVLLTAIAIRATSKLHSHHNHSPPETP